MQKLIACCDMQGKKYEVPATDLEFRPSIYGVIIENNKILLSKQWDGYDFPGGGVHLGETLEEALKREVWEETGLEIKKRELVACEDSFFKTAGSGRFIHSILIYFICEKIGGELSILNSTKEEGDYIDMPEWIELENINNIKYYNSVDSKKIIKKALTILNSRK